MIRLDGMGNGQPSHHCTIAEIVVTCWVSVCPARTAMFSVNVNSTAGAVIDGSIFAALPALRPHGRSRVIMVFLPPRYM